jgi:hypothetical protein
VTLNYGSWDEARLIARAAELFARRGAEGPNGAGGPKGLAEAYPLHRAFLEGHEELERRHPQELAAATRAVDAYDRLLTAVGLRDEQVTSDYALVSAAAFAGRSLLFLFVYLPLAVIGTIFNWPTYRLVGIVAQRLVTEADTVSTYKLFAGFFLFPLTWIAEAVAAGWWTGSPWAGIAVLVLAPLTGRSALSFAERGGRLLEETRAFLLLKTRDRVRESLREKRREALVAVEGLAGLYSGPKVVSEESDVVE